jgi:arylsulfatase A-like enzyme
MLLRVIARQSALRNGLLLASLFVAFVGCRSAPAVPERVVLIVVDTLRRDALSIYGGPLATPQIDALARHGQRFDNAWASFHATTMSMGAMFTGRTPSLEGDGRVMPVTSQTWCGMARFAGRAYGRQCIPASIRTLGEVMSAAGYWSAGVVSNHLIFEPFGLERGFDQWRQVGLLLLPPGNRKRAQDIVHASHDASHVNEEVRLVLAQRPHDRFFLYVHYMDVHDYDLMTGRRGYAAGIPAVDSAVGELRELLADEGLEKNTLIVLTSDHGERLGQKHFVKGHWAHEGNPAFDEVLRVPLLSSLPLADDPGSFVRSQDLFHLLAERVGQGVEIEQELEADELMLTEERWQTYRRGRWKSYLRRRDDALYLVDLNRDAGELVNRAAEHPEIAEKHRERIAVLTDALSGREAGPSQRSARDEERLRAVGYLE